MKSLDHVDAKLADGALRQMLVLCHDCLQTPTSNKCKMVKTKQKDTIICKCDMPWKVGI